MTPDGTLHENLEIKARVRDVAILRTATKRIATKSLGVQQQTDTYFDGSVGRLKLREIQFADDRHLAQLIHYQRDDQTETKSSHYRIMEVPDPAALKTLLTVAYGIRTIISKQREVYLHKNVRIHIDQVAGLGDFMELEAVQSIDMDRHEQQRLVAWLCDVLHIVSNDRLAISYSDLSL